MYFDQADCSTVVWSKVVTSQCQKEIDFFSGLIAVQQFKVSEYSYRQIDAISIT